MKDIIYIGSGAGVSGNNTSVTPAAPTGVAAGDLVLISAGIRGAAAKVRTPTGWKTLVQNENLSLMGRIWTYGDTMPLVTFQGGAAGNTTLAQAHAFRYTESEIELAVHSLNQATNAAAQDVAVPALTVSEPGCLVIDLALKQDDFTSASRAGFDIVAQNSSTTGDDAGTMFLAKVQAVPASEAAGTITVTGGAAALSWSASLAVLPYVTAWTNISGSDSPCDFVTEFNNVSELACSTFTEIDSILDGLINRPAARISANDTAALQDSTVSFTSVDIDPTGFVDIIADPQSIHLDPPGIWMTGVGVNVTYTGLEGTSIELGDSSWDHSTTVRDLNTTNNPPSGGGTGVASSIRTSGTSIRRLSALAMPVGNTIVSTQRAEMYTFRLSD